MVALMLNPPGKKIDSYRTNEHNHDYSSEQPLALHRALIAYRRKENIALNTE